jgi:hypothetical protein
VEGVVTPLVPVVGVGVGAENGLEEGESVMRLFEQPSGPRIKIDKIPMEI